MTRNQDCHAGDPVARKGLSFGTAAYSNKAQHSGRWDYPIPLGLWYMSEALAWDDDWRGNTEALRENPATVPPQVSNGLLSVKEMLHENRPWSFQLTRALVQK
jgi:hypothetical protein